MNQKILIVDDDVLMRDSLTQTLNGEGYNVVTAGSGKEGLHELVQDSYDLIITDLRMPEVSGIELLEEIRGHGDDTPVILITAYGTIQTAVSAMKQGASDYIVKPFQRDALLMAVNKALTHDRLVKENTFFRKQASGDAADARPLIGQSESLQKALKLLEKYAPSSNTVLIRGESGTGKELFARLLHKLSPRADKPMLSVNCAALSAGLLESELFGHEKGAFTGAERRNVGRFEIADGGTILLDEVSEIDTNLQAKLLRVLQEKEFERVGNARTIKVDVRVVGTSNRNLRKEVDEGCFREDLFYRLSQLVINIPPLRERRDDIPILIDYFLKRSAKKNGGALKQFSPKAMKELAAYPWPGNVRELENLVERAYLLCDDGDTMGREYFDGSLHAAGVRPILDNSQLVGRSVEDIEKAHIHATLKHMDWHQQRSAEVLGIGVRTLRDKMKKWNLQKER